MNIFIGCSSSKKLDDIYYNVGTKVASYLSKENDLVFGAFNSGIMGICYNEFKKNKRRIIGIVNKKYENDLKLLNCNTSVLTDTTCERTYKLLQNADILLFLPGGIGTITELFSALEEKRNGMNKPIIIYNENDLFNKTLNLLDDIYINKLSDNDNLYKIVNSIEELKEYIEKIEKEK